MTSQQPYRQTAMTREEAIRELRDKAGKQFDPEIVEVFISLLERERAGQAAGTGR